MIVSCIKLRRKTAGLRDFGTSDWKSKNMNCSAQEIVDAIITAAVQGGSDGRGKDELDGRMFMLARTHRESFGNLLVAALRLKMKAKPEHGAAGKEFLTEEELRAELRESGLPEGIIKYMRPDDARNLPAKLRKDAQPNGTRQVMEATINAAIRHGSDGHGKDGMVGYMLVLERTKLKTFVRLMEMALQWQAAATKKMTTRLTEEQARAGLREAGLPENILKLTRPACTLHPDDMEGDPYLDPEADEEEFPHSAV
jgi:hypothetical protein